MPTTLPALANRADIVEVLFRALDGSDAPLSANQLRDKLPGPYKLKADRLGQILEEELASGRFHRFAPYRSKSPRYWARGPDEHARSTILKVLGNRPLTLNELLRSVKSSLKGLPETRLRRLIQELKDAGQIRDLPNYVGARAKRLSLHPPDPRDYIQNAIDHIAKHLGNISHVQLLEAAVSLLREQCPGQARVSEEDGHAVQAGSVRESEQHSSQVPPADLGELIIEQMAEIEPAAPNGALVSLRELRRSLEFKNIAKATFDTAVLRLAEQGRFALHRHAHPAILTGEEQEELVTDGRGNYFIGIAKRI